MSSAVTRGIRVTVRSEYLPSQSNAKESRYVFAYHIKIENVGSETAQLKTRHWVITDGRGKVEEVRGPGVVGHQPTLGPGEEFQYSSGCALPTTSGTMEGTYQMVTSSGVEFDAKIAPFALALPYALN